MTIQSSACIAQRASVSDGVPDIRSRVNVKCTVYNIMKMPLSQAHYLNDNDKATCTVKFYI